MKHGYTLRGDLKDKETFEAVEFAMKKTFEFLDKHLC